MANNELSYNGYTGSIEVSIADNCLHGRILFIDDIVTYEGETIPEMTSAFQGAVDRYIAHCKESGKQPNKPYSGSTNVRIGQERHRALAQRAFRQKTSINELFCQAVDILLNSDNVGVKAQQTTQLPPNFQLSTVMVIPDPQVQAIFGIGSGLQQDVQYHEATGKTQETYFPVVAGASSKELH